MDKFLKYKTRLTTIFMILLICTFLSKKNKDKNEKTLECPFLILDLYKDYYDLLNKKNTFDIFIKLNEIENIFILIIIVPFIQKEIIITRKNKIYKICQNIFNIHYNENIIINKTFLANINNNFYDLINFDWKILPCSKKINYIKLILKHYYNEQCLSIFQKSLKMNIKIFLYNKKEKPIETINDLMSKK